MLNNYVLIILSLGIFLSWKETFLSRMEFHFGIYLYPSAEERRHLHAGTQIRYVEMKGEKTIYNDLPNNIS